MKRHTREGFKRPIMKLFSFNKPYAATGQVWSRWKSIISKRYPILYYLREVLPVQVSIIFSKFNDAVWWVKYRTVQRNHILKIKGLEPGYCDIDRKMLYANFSLLVEYVEVGLSSRNFEWHSKRRWKKNCAEAGLDYIDWIINDEDIKSNSPNQIEEAIIVRRLYIWWTVERQKRINAWNDPLIWSGVEKPKVKNVDFLFNGWNKNAPYNTATTNMRNTTTFYEDQDQKMLEKLISVRSSLWT